mmetsp:Transcript_50674/g.163898  ORF Transcript_50674/g.163898 Transcript_50674/m.163898 type:complete len:109 (+) Transcript_50674:105-431(+)
MSFIRGCSFTASFQKHLQSRTSQPQSGVVEQDCGFGCDRHAEDMVSPPDTPALARSIVAGSLPPMSPSPSSPATVAESSASSPSSPARRALSRQAAIEDGCSALKSDN